MSRRHDSALWKQTENVTAILSEGHGKYDVFRFRYIDQEHVNPLSERCKDYVLQLLDDYRIEHVMADHQMQQESAKRNITEFCLRQAYKLVWFHEIFRQRHISKALFIFVRFNKQHYFLLDARNIHYRPSDPRNIKRYYVERLNLRDPEYQKTKLIDVMTDFYQDDEKRNANVKKKQAAMNKIYVEEKKDMNLDLYKVEPKDTRSDEAFALFHPELKKIKLTDLTENHNVELDGIKGYFRSLYGDPLYKKKLMAYNRISEPPGPTQIWSKDPRSVFRINSANVKSIRNRLNKGDPYENPFEKSKMVNKKNLLKICTSPYQKEKEKSSSLHSKEQVKKIVETLDSFLIEERMDTSNNNRAQTKKTVVSSSLRFKQK